MDVFMAIVRLTFEFCTVVGIFAVLAVIVAAGFVAWDIRLIKRGK